MKKKNRIIIVSLFLLTLIISSCGKAYRTGTIDKDCTGTYLELGNKDYIICNPEMVESIQDGSNITVKFKSHADCSMNPNLILCEKYHGNSGSIEITEIK